MRLILVLRGLTSLASLEVDAGASHRTDLIRAC